MKVSYIISDPVGLHARPATVMVQVAQKYPNDSFIIFNDKKVTLKSIMIVMSLGIPSQSKIEIEVNGDNPEVVHEAIKNVLIEHQVISV